MPKIKIFQIPESKGGDRIPKGPKEVKGYDMFEEPYGNIFLSAKKKSGKTTLIYNILKHCAGKDVNGDKTKIMAFVSTLNKDPSWKVIKKKFGKNFSGYTSLFDDNGVNILDNLIKNEIKIIQTGGETAEVEEQKSFHVPVAPDIFTNITSRSRDIAIPPGLITDNIFAKQFTDVPSRLFQEIIFGDDFGDSVAFTDPSLDPNLQIAEEGREFIKPKDAEKKKKKQKGKGSSLIAPSYIFIFDDLASELQNKVLTQLLKKNRHFRSKIIISSQNFKDIAKQGRAQIDYLVLFRGLSADRQKQIHSEMCNFVPFKEFVDSYLNATHPKFGFLKVDRVNDEISSNFD
jgi:hypothetical protein